MTMQVSVKRSPYVNYAWCTLCGEYIPRDELTFNKNGREMCPYCGRAVRNKPHKKKRKIGGVVNDNM